MTIRDDQATTTPTPTARPESSSAGTEPPAARTVPSATSDNSSSATMTPDSPPRQDEPPIVDDESSMARAEQSQMGNVPPTAGVEPSADELLFADDVSRLRSRWDDVQAAFVDDPTECVQKADALVAEVVEQLTAGFSEARSRLEAQWARGENASTEDLRLALRRYREFFQRLLAV
jgi:hypothetical protein